MKMPDVTDKLLLKQPYANKCLCDERMRSVTGMLSQACLLDANRWEFHLVWAVNRLYCVILHHVFCIQSIAIIWLADYNKLLENLKSPSKALITFMHLADTFIQSDFNALQVYCTVHINNYVPLFHHESCYVFHGRKSYRFRTTQGRANDGRSFIWLNYNYNPF